MGYLPGTHSLLTIITHKKYLLETSGEFKAFIDAEIEKHSLNKLGEVYYNFPSAGYTAVVCLSESHLSVHTWPEYNKVNIDIYLSNFLRNNDGTVKAITQALKSFFEGNIEHEHQIRR